VDTWRQIGNRRRRQVEETGEYPSDMTSLDWECIRLMDEIDHATAQCAAELSKTIVSAASKSWGAAAWWLERRCPEEFGRPGAKKEGEEDSANAVHIYIPDNGRGPGGLP
jgi:hypothetical protein